jgi:hypothetical protein
LICGAVTSIGLIAASTLQYSGTSAAPVPAAGTTAALVTVPPVVGKPIDAAGIAMPLRSAQLLVTRTAVGVLLVSLPPHPVSPTPAIAAAVNATATDFILQFFMFRLLFVMLFAPAALLPSAFPTSFWPWPRPCLKGFGVKHIPGCAQASTQFRKCISCPSSLPLAPQGFASVYASNVRIAG